MLTFEILLEAHVEPCDINGTFSRTLTLHEGVLNADLGGAFRGSYAAKIVRSICSSLTLHHGALNADHWG